MNMHLIVSYTFMYILKNNLVQGDSPMRHTSKGGNGAYKNNISTCVTTPLWAKCEDETHTLESGDLKSSGTPENSEFNCRGQSTSHWGFLYINGKVLKFRCPKWPRMIHLDICSPSYRQKKGRESN